VGEGKGLGEDGDGVGEFGTTVGEGPSVAELGREESGGENSTLPVQPATNNVSVKTDTTFTVYDGKCGILIVCGIGKLASSRTEKQRSVNEGS